MLEKSDLKLWGLPFEESHLWTESSLYEYHFECEKRKQFYLHTYRAWEFWNQCNFSWLRMSFFSFFRLWSWNRKAKEYNVFIRDWTLANLDIIPILFKDITVRLLVKHQWVLFYLWSFIYERSFVIPDSPSTRLSQHLNWWSIQETSNLNGLSSSGSFLLPNLIKKKRATDWIIYGQNFYRSLHLHSKLSRTLSIFPKKRFSLAYLWYAQL